MFTRLLSALHKAGLDVLKIEGGWQVRLLECKDLPYADILLPDNLKVESKAFLQLANLSSASGVVKCCATPDFHPGDSGVAIGSVILTEHPIPAAVGDDINCGMRLHLSDLTYENFMTHRDRLVEKLKGDYFFGTRDVAQHWSVQREMFNSGVLGWLDGQKSVNWKYGSVEKSDHNQLLREVESTQYLAQGDYLFAPSDLVPDSGIVRDDGLGTIGGGNHFIEFQIVDEIYDRHLAYLHGIKFGSVGFMVHTGSRFVGKFIGHNMQSLAKSIWAATGKKYPAGEMFPMSGENTETYLKAEATAANYGSVNRLLVAEIARLRMREVFGDNLELELVTDIPHNFTQEFKGKYIQRKGACAAFNNLSIIQGSMGSPSYVCVGSNNADRLYSASHGAGRASARVDMKRVEILGLEGIDCVTLREERRIEEAPAAYKPIQSVIDSQVNAGVIRKVARLKPILTFKA
jgi:tRNA-splicing ligase RtcB